MKDFQCLACSAAFVLAIASASSAQTCGTEVTFDMSPWVPASVVGEAISITPIQGVIVNARVDAVFVSNQEDPWSMYANFAFPTGIIGVDSITGGWSGIGTFKATVESDAINGFLVAPAGSSFVTWFLKWGGGAPFKLPGGGIGLGPMDGYFEQLKLTITLADCPAGDADANLKVDVDDLLIVINSWGSCSPPLPMEKDQCDADITGDGVVNVDDLLQVINNWGNYWCPPPFC